MSLHSKEKIWFLINAISEERDITPANEPIALHPVQDLNKHYQPQDILNLFDKLEKDDNAVKLIGMPTDQTWNKYVVKLLPGFDKYVEKLRQDPKYLDWIGEKPEPEPSAATPKISYAQASAKKNGVMTGKDKIQAVVEEINDAYQGLVTGNVVMVFSGNLDAKGIRLREQKQVLDILANDKKVIKYTAKNTYASQADIPPSTQVDVYEIASDVGKTTEEMFDEILEELTYSIDVLSGFEALADKLFGNAELEHQQDVYLLRLLYNRVIAILDAVVSAGVVIEDDKLDFVFVKLTSVIESILSKQTMKSWEKDAPELYDTLLGHAEDIGEGWQYSRAAVLKYYAKLQKDWMLNNHVEFELDDKLAALFEEIDGLIAEHKKAAREAADNWYKRTDAYAKDFRKRGVFIDKQPKPQPNYPDDAPAHFDDDEEQPSEPKSTEISQDKVRFDAKASKLTFDGKNCGIPDETLEYYICKLVFKNRKVAAKEDDILEYTTKSQDSQRAVYDAMLRINKKAREQLGVEKLLSYKAAKVRIAANYQ